LFAAGFDCARARAPIVNGTAQKAAVLRARIAAHRRIAFREIFMRTAP